MSESIKRLPSPAKLKEPWAVTLPFPQVANPPVIPFPVEDASEAITALPLVKRLCEVLDAEAISYCHWKSNWKISRWLNGDGDLDLLVARADAKRFASASSKLGFVQAAPPGDDTTPGVLHLYGWDDEAEKFVHLHVYHKLLVGHDLTINYHLPLEDLLLQSDTRVGPIRISEPELELIVFVLRKLLGFSTAETILRRTLGRSDEFEKTAEELAYLEAHADRVRVYELLKQIVPRVPVVFFERYLQSLRIDSTLWNRTKAQRQLEKTFTACALRSPLNDGILKAWRFASTTCRKRILGRTNRKQLVNGGVLIAIVGGDGSGKTTAVKSVRRWLEGNFAVRAFHFGKPRRAPLTIAGILCLRARRLFKFTLRRLPPQGHSQRHAGYLQMVRWVCAARDRHRVYAKARRFASNGGIAICDRYLVRGINLMDGPNIARDLAGSKLNWVSRILLKSEELRYRQVGPPDLLLVLRVDPKIAVRRKTDEQEQHVRTRSEEVWRLDWSNTGARIIDASRPAAIVFSDLRDRIWQRLQQPRLMTRPFTAEIVGPAGAGKSTLTKLLRERNAAMRTGLSIWGLPLRLLGTSTLSSLPDLVSLFRNGRISREDLKLVIQINALRRLLRRESAKGYGGLVLDEGGVFGLAKLRAFGAGSKSGTSISWMSGLFDQVGPTLDAIIWLDAPNTVLARRIREREKPHRTKHLSEAEICDYLDRYRDAFERVIAELSQRNRIKVIRFRTDQEPLEAVAKQILARACGEN